MNVASLELCEELFELSGWECRPSKYRRDGTLVTWGYMSLNKSDIPAYDLGYLLRKLPGVYDLKISKSKADIGMELLIYQSNAVEGAFTVSVIATADTPENALTKLAIELFKQGVLQKEQQ